MATNYNLPAAGSAFPGFIGPDIGLEDQLGILHSFNIIGGHSEMPAYKTCMKYLLLQTLA